MNRLTKKFYMTMVNNIAKSHGLKVQSKATDRKAVWEAELARLNKNPKVNFNRKLRAFENKFQRKEDNPYRRHYMEVPKRSVELKFKYSFIDTNTHQRKTKTEAKATVNIEGEIPNRTVLDKLAREAALEYIRRRVTAAYMDEVNVDDVKVISSIPMSKHAKSLSRVPVFGRSLTYPRLNLNGDDDSGICGFKYLLEEYPKRSQSIEYLERFFNRPREWGLTALDFEKFADHHNLSVYVCDLLFNKIVCKSADTNRRRDQENQPLVGVIANDHFYRVDNDMRKQMIHIMLGGVKRDFTGDELLQDLSKDLKEETNEVVFLKRIPSEFEPRTTYVIDTDNLNSFYFSLLDDDKAYPCKCTEDHVTAVFLTDKKVNSTSTRIFANPQFEMVYAVCQQFNIPFKNQTLASLTKKIWREFESAFHSEWKQSVLNAELRTLYNNSESPMHTHPFTFHLCPFEDIPEHYEKHGIDIKRNYTQIAMEGNFYTHGILDSVQEYQCGQEIVPARYYVETDVYMPPFDGNGFHDYLVIREALELALITHDQIKYFVPATLSKSNDKRLKEFVEYIYALPIEDKLKKNMINTLIGTFGITKSKKMGPPAITSSLYDAQYYHNIFNGQATVTKLPTRNTLYKVQPFEILNQLATDMPIRLTVVDRANMKAFKLLQYVRRFEHVIPYAFKTDCILYATQHGPIPTIEPSKAKFGDYRAEKVEFKEYKYEAKQPRIKKYVMKQKEWTDLTIANKNEYFDWTIIPEYQRCHIGGSAGAGKTFIINKLREHFGDSFLYTAFTHTATNNIDGKTLHSTLNMSISEQGEKACRNALKNMLANYQGIIIDEISQVGRDIFNILCQLPNTFRIYTFGDFRQEPPIEPNAGLHNELYVNTDMFKILMNGSKIVLTKNCRSDAGWGDACAEYHDHVEAEIQEFQTPEEVFKHFHSSPFIGKDIIEPYIKKWTARSEFVDMLACGQQTSTSNQDEINIVKTNDFRMLLNHYWMLDRKQEDSPCITPSETNLDGQVMWLYQGLPVVMNVDSIHDRQLFKNEMYVVSSFNGTKITLKYRLLNNNVKYLIKYINKSITITHQEFADWFAPAYAITTYKVQGQTIAHPHTIWEFNRMLHKSRYTALTRTTDPKLVTIINVKRSDISLEDILAKDPIYKYNIARIYRITDGSKSYYGSTVKSIEERFEEHKYCARQGTSKLYRYMREIGTANFQVKLVKEFNYINSNHILRKENMYIEMYDSITYGLNERLNTISRPKKLRPVHWCSDCQHEFKTKDAFNEHINEHKHLRHVLPIDCVVTSKPKQTADEYDFTFRYLDKFFLNDIHARGSIRNFISQHKQRICRSK